MAVRQRLAKFIQEAAAASPYALLGHSLGSVLIRAVLSRLETNPPTPCFFLAPHSQACIAAKFFAGNVFYRLLMGEMGQLLANEKFMASLPVPSMPCRIYAGTGGPIGKFSPFGNQVNDGILTVEEAQGTLGIPVSLIPSSHTFIMNSRQVAEDVAATLANLHSSASSKKSSRNVKKTVRALVTGRAIKPFMVRQAHHERLNLMVLRRVSLYLSIPYFG